MRAAPDVLVIGGGVIGCAVADALAGAGLGVLLADRGALGGEASTASAGVLAVASGGEAEGPRLDLRRASLARFAALAARLQAETGIDVAHAVTGVLEPVLTDAEEAAAEARAAQRRAQGFRVEHLDPKALRAAEPLVNPVARGALLFADDAQVDPARLVEALAASARRRGAELLPGTPVLGTERMDDRLARVRVGADWVTPGTVVLAAGAWAAHVPDVAPGLTVAPARGQMLALRPARPLSRHILSYADGYLVPQPSGEWLVGATVEHVGFDRTVTPAGLEALFAKLAVLVPAGLDAPVARAWAGLRPYAPGGLPIVGRAPATVNLLLACGHHRNGILLAPATADVVAALAGAAPLPADLAPCLPALRGAA